MSLERLTGLGTCVYGVPPNAYTFSPAMQTLSITGSPKYDQSGRTVLYTVWRLTLYDEITIGTPFTTDNLLDSAKFYLTRPADAFQYQNKGFGNFAINTVDNFNRLTQDVVWGPTPLAFDAKMLGRAQAWGITWTVEVHLARCQVAAANGFPFNLLESNYTVSYSIDQSGLTTRVVSGFLRIPQTRSSVNNRTLGNNADLYRPWIVPQAPQGFRRVSGTFALDESKCKLTYSITDVEMPNVNSPPPGIVDISDRHSVTTGPYLSDQNTGVISASYEVAKGLPKSIAYNYFMRLLTSRLSFAQNVNETAILTGLSLSEDEIHGRRTASCTANYRLIVPRRKLLAASGLWQPVPDSDYNQWATSLKRHAFNDFGRGLAGFTFQNQGDLIVDLCTNGGVAIINDGGFSPVVGADGGGNGAGNGGGDEFVQPYPSLDVSFLDYSLDTVVLLDDEIVEMKPLPASSIQETQSAPSMSIVLPPSSGGSLLESPPSDQASQLGKQAQVPAPYPGLSGTQSILTQQRAAPSIEVWLIGQAIRAGYDINPPELVSFGGVTPISANAAELGCGFSRKIREMMFGVPIVRASWALRWVIPTLPNEAPPVYPNLASSGG